MPLPTEIPPVYGSEDNPRICGLDIHIGYGMHKHDPNEVLGWYINSRHPQMPPTITTSLPEPDMVNHPTHYTAHPSGIECITITEWYNFNIGNAIKYLWRSDNKGGLEDLRKAQWYITREIERIEKAGG
jgi:hypothetical protein